MDEASLRKALHGCGTIYYLVHSMVSQKGKYRDADRIGAENMVKALASEKAEHIICLGGLGDVSNKNISRHLISRHEVGEILKKGPVPVTVSHAAKIEMKQTGYMHSYMRMCWGKKILEWSKEPEQAFYRTLELNNKYLLDGRDPNFFAGVAWLFGMHDRPWARRSIFGTVPYMAASGLERKCDIKAYVQRIRDLDNKPDNPKKDLIRV